MRQHEKLCYLPTRKLCSLNEALEDEHFTEARENVFRQETTTYEYVDEGVKSPGLFATIAATFTGIAPAGDHQASGGLEWPHAPLKTPA